MAIVALDLVAVDLAALALQQEHQHGVAVVAPLERNLLVRVVGVRDHHDATLVDHDLLHAIPSPAHSLLLEEVRLDTPSVLEVDAELRILLEPLADRALRDVQLGAYLRDVAASGSQCADASLGLGNVHETLLVPASHDVEGPNRQRLSEGTLLNCAFFYYALGDMRKKILLSSPNILCEPCIVVPERHPVSPWPVVCGQRLPAAGTCTLLEQAPLLGRATHAHTTHKLDSEPVRLVTWPAPRGPRRAIGGARDTENVPDLVDEAGGIGPAVPGEAGDVLGYPHRGLHLPSMDQATQLELGEARAWDPTASGLDELDCVQGPAQQDTDDL